VQTKLRDLAGQRALTLSDISTLAHVPYAGVRRLATNPSNVPLAHAMLVARTLELPLEQVFALTHDSAEPQTDHAEK
jgi:hypothetical protein